jgi:hypothetical protein
LRRNPGITTTDQPMTTTYRTRLAALRDPVGVMRQLEN